MFWPFSCLVTHINASFENTQDAPLERAGLFRLFRAVRDVSRKGKAFSGVASDDVKTGLARGIADDWMTPARFAFILGLLIVAAFPSVLLKGQTFTVRDFGMFSYPVAFFHRQAFWKGELPQWDPLNYCGVPFLAQWNTMTLYPGTLIYLLLPMPWSLSFFCLAHLFWGGLGMFYLARRWTGNGLAAALAGIFFSFNGLPLNFLMWPSHIATFSWVPWVLLLVPQGWRQGARKLYCATFAASMQMLAGGPETILLTWAILFSLACGDWFSARSRTKRYLDEPAPHPEALVSALADPASNPSPHQLVFRFGGMVLLVALLCAVQLLPFLELVAHSERDSSFSALSPNWSMSIWGLGDFLVPLFHTVSTSQHITLPFGQGWTSSYYAGIGAVFLAAVGLRRVADWRMRLLAALVCLCLLLALGDAGILYRGLRVFVPQIGFVRYPVKFVILVSAVVPLLAALGFATLISRSGKSLGRFEWTVVIALLFLVAALIGIEAWRPLLPGASRTTLHNGLARAGLLCLCVFCIVKIRTASEHRRVLFGSLLLAVCWLDLISQVPTQNPTMPPMAYRSNLARQKLGTAAFPYFGQSRVMLSPAADQTLRYNGLPNLEQSFLVHRWAAFGDCNLLDAVPQAYGFFSLAPGPIGNLTSLPYVQTNLDYTKVLDFMSVSRTTRPGTLFDWVPRRTAMPLVTAGQAPVFVSDQRIIDAFFQSDTDLRQTAFLPPEAKLSVTAQRCPGARILNAVFSAQDVSIKTSTPAASLVIISQSWYPAWKAYIDGKRTKLWRANYAFQAVQVPAGRHTINLAYQDRGFQLGLALSFLGSAAWVIGFFKTRSHRELA